MADDIISFDYLTRFRRIAYYLPTSQSSNNGEAASPHSWIHGARNEPTCKKCDVPTFLRGLEALLLGAGFAGGRGLCVLATDPFSASFFSSDSSSRRASSSSTYLELHDRERGSTESIWAARRSRKMSTDVSRASGPDFKGGATICSSLFSVPSVSESSPAHLACSEARKIAARSRLMLFALALIADLKRRCRRRTAAAYTWKSHLGPPLRSLPLFGRSR
jgi:hypothetical protein